MFILRATDEVVVRCPRPGPVMNLLTYVDNVDTLLLLTLRSCQAELAHHISAQYRLRAAAAAPIQTIDVEGIHHGIWDSSYSNLLGRGGGVRSDHLLLGIVTLLSSAHTLWPSGFWVGIRYVTRCG